MKRWLGNIFIRLILNADKGLKAKLFDSLEINNSILSEKNRPLADLLFYMKTDLAVY